MMPGLAAMASSLSAPLTLLVVSSRIREEIMVSHVLGHDPIDEGVAVLGGSEARMVEEQRVRIRSMCPPNREDVVGIDPHTLRQFSVHLLHHLRLPMGWLVSGSRRP